MSAHKVTGSSENPSFLKIVEKVFLLLETLAQSEQGMRVSDLSRSLKQPKATVYRILFTLEKLGYVRQNANTMAYLCTSHASWLTRDQSNVLLRQIARSHMERLLARFEQTVNLAVFDRDRVFYIDILEGIRSIRMAATPMTYAPMHCTAVGKSILAFLDKSEIQQILNQRSMDRHTAKTIVSEKMLTATFPLIQKQGYAIDDEEMEIGARCIAAPIFNPHGRPVAAISVSGPVNYMKATLCSQVAKALKDAGQQMSSQLGFVAHTKPAARKKSPDSSFGEN